jgi:hypothetical protein
LARSFNGTSDRLDVANPSNFAFDGSTAFSVSVWLYPTSTGFMVAIGKRDLSVSSLGWFFGQSGVSGDFTFDLTAQASSGGEAQVFGPTNTLTQNAWNHAVGTYDGSKSTDGMLMYVNGTLLSTTVGVNNLTGSILNSLPVQFGCDNGTTSPEGFWHGSIERPAIWSGVVLTQAQVSQLFGGIDPAVVQPTGLISDWIFTGAAVERDRYGSNDATPAGTTFVAGPSVFLDSPGPVKQRHPAARFRPWARHAAVPGTPGPPILDRLGLAPSPVHPSDRFRPWAKKLLAPTGLLLVTSSIDLPLSAAGGVAQTGGEPIEAIQALAITGNAEPVEASQAVVATGPAEPVEALGGVAQTGGDPVEALGGVAQTGGEPVEATQALAITGNAEPVEALQAVAATGPDEPIEALDGVAQTGSDPIEATGGVAQTGSDPVEATQALAITGNAEPVEALGGLAQTGSDPLEALGGLAQTGSDPVEATGGISQTGSEPVEALGAVAASGDDPVESGQQAGSVSQSAVLPIEATGAVTQTGGDPLEALAAVVASAQLPLEQLAGLTAAVAQLVEAQQGLATSAASPIEAAQGVAAAAAAVLEALQGIAPTGGEPIEAGITGSFPGIVQLVLETAAAVTLALEQVAIVLLSTEPTGSAKVELSD